MIRLSARHAVVQAEGRRWRCTLRKSLFHQMAAYTRPVAVGDRVAIRIFGPRDAVIEKVFDRRSCLAREHKITGRQQVIVANVDQVVVTVSLAQPPLRRGIIDRLLVAAEREEVPALIVFNKCDLVPEREPFEEVARIYRAIGYPVLFTSAVTGEGVEELRSRLEGLTTVLAGHSGVGKSSLLNAVQPGLKLKVGEISSKWGKGRHTTTAVSLLPLEGGGFVVDTPGFRSFGIVGLEKWQVGLLFPEIKAIAPGCHYPTCTHTHEPECAVKRALEEGRIDPERFESYLRIVEGEEDLLFDEDEEEEDVMDTTPETDAGERA